MPVVYDNWARLVEAVLDKVKLRQIALRPSFHSVLSDSSSRFSFDSSIEDYVLGYGFPSNSTALSSSFSLSYSDESSIENLADVHPIEFEEIRLATSHFRNLLGEGGFGRVYKGWIDMTPVAVKKWNPEGPQGRAEFVTQLHYLQLLGHPNLVKLVAYCFERKNMLLIYEYMPNGSLERHLFGGELSLSWASRINVAIDVAKALTFLHGREIRVAHQNVKASNILLDYGFKAKLSGFSSARYINAAVDLSYVSLRFGTYSFAAFGSLAKGDVFDFGIVLLELLSGCRAIDQTKSTLEEQELVKWAKSNSRKKLWQIIDEKMEGQYPKKIAYKAASLALRCVSPIPDERPRMAEVLFSLEQLKAEQSRLGN